jgi:putative ABC transport system permease protein
MLIESALVATLGGALGLLLTWWLSVSLVSLAPPTLPGLTEIRIDGRILLFTAAVSLLTAMLCGLLPALEVSRPSASDALKEAGRTGTSGRQRRIFSTLVVAQIAVAVVLLVGGGLLVRSFSKLLSVEPGFNGDRVLTMETSLPAAGYRTGADVRTFYTRLLPRIQSLPGVSAAGASTDLPLRVREHRAFTIENESAATRALPHAIAQVWILGDYLSAMGIPLKRGRHLAPEDHAAAEPVAVINETMARQYWGAADPVGHRIAWGGPTQHGPWMRIVGIVGDVKQGALNTETQPQAYTPWLQVSDNSLGDNVVGMLRALRLTVRTDIEPSAIAELVRHQIRALDPSLPVTAVQTMDEILRASSAPQRFNTMVIGSFAVLALLLAGLGIAGVLATSVSGRARELGVRLALGAQPRALVRMVVREGMTLAAIGLVIGWPAAWILSHVMSTMLFGVSPRDPLTFASVGAILTAGALLACWVPAWRASRIDPLAALRRE